MGETVYSENGDEKYDLAIQVITSFQRLRAWKLYKVYDWLNNVKENLNNKSDKKEFAVAILKSVV